MTAASYPCDSISAYRSRAPSTISFPLFSLCSIQAHNDGFQNEFLMKFLENRGSLCSLPQQRYNLGWASSTHQAAEGGRLKKSAQTSNWSPMSRQMRRRNSISWSSATQYARYL